MLNAKKPKKASPLFVIFTLSVKLVKKKNNFINTSAITKRTLGRLKSSKLSSAQRVLALQWKK